jgi:thiol-disulfide isomerase/thioredoxin
MKRFFVQVSTSQAIQWAKIVFSVILISFALKYTGILNSTHDDQSVVGKTFEYNFDLKDLNGNIVHMEDLKGKVVFLNMWATWCGPCRSEMPSIHKLYSKVSGNDISFVMLSLDTEENQPKVIKYLADKHFTFPVYQSAGSLPRQLQVPTIPTTFIIGKDGKIKMKKVGMEDYDTESFETMLKDLAADQPQ